MSADVAFSMKKISAMLQELSRDVADFHRTIQQQQLEIEHRAWVLSEVNQAVADLSVLFQTLPLEQVPPIFRSLEQLDLSQTAYEAVKESYPAVALVIQLTSFQNTPKLDGAVIEEIHQKLGKLGLKFGMVPQLVWEP